MLVIIGLLFPVLQLSAFCRLSALCRPSASPSLHAGYFLSCLRNSQSYCRLFALYWPTAALSLNAGSSLSCFLQPFLVSYHLSAAGCPPVPLSWQPLLSALQSLLSPLPALSLITNSLSLSCRTSALSLSKDLRLCLSSSLSSCLITISLHPPDLRWPSSLVAGSISTLLLHKFICAIPYRSDLPATARLRSFLWVSCPNPYHFWDSVLL